MLPRNYFDKICVIWCILSVPKLVIINLKINIFWIINQQPKFCVIFFSKINPDAHFGKKTNKYIHILQGGGLGAIAPRSQRNVKKNGGFKFFIPGAKMYPVMMSFQIHARGSRIFFD